MTQLVIDKTGLVSIKYFLSMLDAETFANLQNCGVERFFIPLFFACN